MGQLYHGACRLRKCWTNFSLYALMQKLQPRFLKRSYWELYGLWVCITRGQRRSRGSLASIWRASGLMWLSYMVLASECVYLSCFALFNLDVSPIGTRMCCHDLFWPACCFLLLFLISPPRAFRYAADAYAMFCMGAVEEVNPHDHKLVKYWQFLCKWRAQERRKQLARGVFWGGSSWKCFGEVVKFAFW